MRKIYKTLTEKIILPVFGGFALGEAAYAYKKGAHYKGVLKPKGSLHPNSVRIFNRIFNAKYIAIGIAIALCWIFI